MGSISCANPSVEQGDLSVQLPADTHIEHIIPLFTAARFASVANWGRHWLPMPYIDPYISFPLGAPTQTPGIRTAFWEDVWNNPEGLPRNLPLVTPDSADLRRPVDRVFEALGSNTNPSHFVLIQSAINNVKGQFEAFAFPMQDNEFNGYVRQALAGNNTAIRCFLAPLRETIAMFQYLRDPDIDSRRNTIATSVTEQLQLIEQHTEGSEGLTAHWHEFYPFYFSQVSEFARNWVNDRVRYIQRTFAGSESYERDFVLKEAQEIEKQIPDLKYPWED
ncbi:hypothetical protein EKO27_g7496 [Xylaria grammica]|uniref:Uncharacterized protein n=1 Tax=Xylaria grammica TaxID=363999 RepID=A0A439D029_9PEZI|nr:hypothetical protein EKO27_g7496 [Xylaria grammica]